VDEEASTFWLIHHILRKYLCTHHNLFPRVQLAMAETCLTYLNSDQSKALPAKPQPDLSSLPSPKYCSRYWGTHAERELSDHTRLLAIRLLDQFENHVAANSLFEKVLDPGDSLEANAPLLFGGLHCASFFGIVDVMTDFLGTSGCDTNRGGSAGITLLAWAVRGGQDEAVELLLGLEAANLNKPDNKGRNPLTCTAIKGYEPVAKQLLDREDVNPDKPDIKGIAPLSAAAASGHQLILNQLPNHEDVNPNKPDHKSRTPLTWLRLGGMNLW